MNMMVTHTFVAARSFVQGLMVSGEVVRKVSQVKPLYYCTIYTTCSLYFLLFFYFPDNYSAVFIPVIQFVFIVCNEIN